MNYVLRRWTRDAAPKFHSSTVLNNQEDNLNVDRVNGVVREIHTTHEYVIN